ncbi:MAG: hypothetical protein H6Q03_717 [Acidobacteria bacterium]|nr:hypothetical protein [Acidobacteriota bacterium]
MTVFRPTIRRSRSLISAPAVLVLALLAAAPAAAEERALEQTFDAAAVTAVELENLAGEVTLVAAAGSTGRIAGTVHAEASAGETGAALVEALQVRFDREGGKLVARADYPTDRHRRYHYPARSSDRDGEDSWLVSWLGGSGSSVTYQKRQVRVSSSASSDAATLWADFRIEVPAGVAVTVRNSVGRIGSTGVAADQSLDTASGDIESTGGRGALSADTGSGDVQVVDHEGGVVADTGSGDVSFERVRGEKLAADTGSGDVHLLDCAGALVADTGSGDIRGRGLTLGRQAHADTGSGDIRLEGDFSAVRDLRIDTGSGNVVLDVTAAPSVHLVVSTGSGDIDVDLPDMKVRQVKGEFVADISGGEGKGVIDTGSGDVTIASR